MRFSATRDAVDSSLTRSALVALLVAGLALLRLHDRPRLDVRAIDQKLEANNARLAKMSRDGPRASAIFDQNVELFWQRNEILQHSDERR
ncbi:MAG: hypothetical protein U0166_00175 [Acidobacteriota bacterium]